jgi:hypothetical protein
MTPDGRGGWISTETFDKASGEKWMHAIGLDDAAECSQVFKGKNAPLNLELVPRTMIVEKITGRTSRICGGDKAAY